MESGIGAVVIMPQNIAITTPYRTTGLKSSFHLPAAEPYSGFAYLHRTAHELIHVSGVPCMVTSLAGVVGVFRADLMVFKG